MSTQNERQGKPVDVQLMELEQENDGLREQLAQAKHFNTALQNSEEQYRTLFENAIDLIQIVAPDGSLLFVNAAWRRKFGYEQDEIAGLSIFDLIAPDFRAHCQVAFGTVMTEGCVENLVTTFLTKDGDRVELQGNAKCSFDSLGNPVSSQCIFQDVTMIREREEEALHAERLESLGILAGGLAHDFNNFLTAILGNISLARVHAESNPETTRCLLKAEGASLRAQGLARQLLMFSKGGASIKRPVQFGPVLCDSAEFASRGSKTKVEFEIADDLWVVEVDTDQISQTIHNLVINASQAMSEGGTATIRAANVDADEAVAIGLPKGQYLRVEVEDHGQGISAEGQQKLFDPYYTTKETGTGLGLAVTQSVIQSHGGEIRVKSRVDEGTTFTVYLPASSSAVVETVDPADIAPKGRGRVLVMDDDLMIREMVAEMLVSLGYDVEAVPGGEEAIRLYREAREGDRPFDLLLLDLTVPGGLGGEWVCEEIRKVNPDVKVILSSGYVKEGGPLDLLEAGSASFLQKPYNLGTLARRIQNELNAG